MSSARAAVCAGLRITEPLPAVLFDHRLLIGAGQLGLRRIGFGFGLLRNYIIAFHVRRWNTLTPDAFAKECAQIAPGSLPAEVLTFYYPFAPDAHKRAVDGPVREHALDYLNNYTTLIEEFPALRAFFAPQTTGKIGFVGELRFPPEISMYGFRRIAEADDEVLLIPVDSSDRHSIRLFAAGVNAPHSYGVAKGFRSPVPANQIRGSEIVDQLSDMVDKGRLNETAAPELAEELIACILKSHQFFGGFVDPKTKRLRYPIDLSDVTTALRREFLDRHFHDEAIQAKRQRGEIKETWRGATVSYVATLSPDEEKHVEARVHEAIETGNDVPMKVHYADLEQLKTRLDAALQALRHHGTQALAGPVLPLANDLAAVSRKGVDAPFDIVKEHCRRVLLLALRSYRHMVETNFPSFTSQCRHYQRTPMGAILLIESGSLIAEGVSIFVRCESRSKIDEVLVCDASEVSLDLDNRTVTTSAGTQTYLTVSWQHVGNFVHGPLTGRLEYDCDAAVVRRLVYGWMQNDFREIKREWLRASSPFARTD